MKAEFLGVFEMHAKVADWFFDKTKDAEDVFNGARKDYLKHDARMPDIGTGVRRIDEETPELGSGPRNNGPSAAPALADPVVDRALPVRRCPARSALSVRPTSSSHR